MLSLALHYRQTKAGLPARWAVILRSRRRLRQIWISCCSARAFDGRFTAAGVVFFLLLFATMAGAAIRIESGQIGNVFLSNEKVAIPLTCDGGEISWKVTDYFGTVVIEGRETSTNKRAIIQPPLKRVGYFDLHLTEHDGTSAMSTLTTSFAVLTPIDVAKLTNSPFGAMTHFAQHNDPAVMSLLARAGIAHIRDEQYWSAIETQPAVYSYPSKFLSYMSAAGTYSLTPLIPLNWSNRFYDFDNGDYTFPYTESGRKGYVNYALNVLDRYPGQIKAVELWNEINAGTFIAGPATADKPGYYSLLLKEAYPTIKSLHPAVKVVAGATVPIAHGFFKSLFEKGAMPYFDAVSIHPYRDYPDGVDLEIAELRELIKTYNGGQPKSIWATEFGFSASDEPERYAAASYLAQIGLLMLSQSVERMYYYLAIDDTLFPFRGLVGVASDARGAFRPHPALVAYATLIRQLDGATYHSRFTTPPSIYALRFQRGEDQVSVLWSNHPVPVSVATSSELIVADIMGGISTKSPIAGSVSVNLSRDVQYVVGQVTSVTDTAKELLADSVSGYSKMAGKNGWYYGYAELGSTASYDPSHFKQMSWGIWGSDNYRWLGTGAYPFASGSLMHPSGAWAIRRWVSDTSGDVTLSGSVSRGEGGDGVGIRIFVDGDEVYSRNLAPTQSVEYSVPNVAIKFGSKIDFTLNHRNESSFDATSFTSRITRRPESPPDAPNGFNLSN